MEAHAALALGPPSTWDAIAGYYGSAGEPFTDQLRLLENHAAKNPTAGEAHFLLGYLYQGMGYQKEAQKLFSEASRLSPRDEIAKRMAGQQSGEATPAPTATPATKEVPPYPTPALSKQPQR